MQYLISFLEGIITFISPCLLPMLPIYISYFAGGDGAKPKSALLGAAGFVSGFTLVFTALGALAGTLGSFFTRYQTALDILCGAVVIFFGLSFLGVFDLGLFKGVSGSFNAGRSGFLSSALFGAVFSISWTPCVGAFLGSALLLASQQGSALVGVGMLLCYSLGLGIPFILSAVLIDRLKAAFDFIKRNYRIINIVSGSVLIVVGVMMATGTLGRLLALLS